MDLMYFLELAVNGGLAGLMYGLVAMAIVLIYKSSSVPNLAQGALVMVGAYLVLAVAGALNIPLWLAIPAAMVAMFFLGVGIERVALRRLAGRPIVMILMMTLGIDIFLRATAMTIWGGMRTPWGSAWAPRSRLGARRPGRRDGGDVRLSPRPARPRPSAATRRRCAGGAHRAPRRCATAAGSTRLPPPRPRASAAAAAPRAGSSPRRTAPASRPGRGAARGTSPSLLP